MNEPLRLASDPALVEAGAAQEAARPTPIDFDDLVHAEHAGLYGALCLIIRDRGEAEDVMQEAFLKVWELRRTPIHDKDQATVTGNVTRLTFQQRTRGDHGRRSRRDRLAAGGPATRAGPRRLREGVSSAGLSACVRSPQ